jgi:hypothetical protein
MIYPVLLALHVAVLGYWLGSEFVINSEYRFVVRRADLPVSARNAMMDHVMQVDQHVRYALVLQATLGLMLLGGMGLMPGIVMWIAPLAGLGWLAMVEAVHRTRKAPIGRHLARIDRMFRYVLAAMLIAAALAAPDWPVWLRLKLALFAGVIACGVLIRMALIRHFQIWHEIVTSGSTQDREIAVRAIYRKATGILLILWTQIAAIALLGLFKPM